MNDHKNVIDQLIAGSGFGICGFAMFVVAVGGLSVKTSISYALVAAISGAVAFMMAGRSPYSESAFFFAILAGWLFFFVIKIVSKILVIASIDPYKAWSKIRHGKDDDKS